MTDTTTITITDDQIRDHLESEFGDYAPELSALIEGGYLEAIRDVLAMEAEEDGGWTWWDNDPDVAWGADVETEPSFHGRLREIYYAVGWEPCYHERGYRAAFHFNVKMDGSGAYRAFRKRVDEVNAARAGMMDTDEVEEIARGIEEWDLRSWWEGILPERADQFGVGQRYSGRQGDRQPDRGTVWYSCGRSDGYATMPERYMTRGVSMVLMAWELASSREYYNGPDWGTYLADQAIERYDDDRLEELASPRSAVPYQ